jgi:hypothetical protein
MADAVMADVVHSNWWATGNTMSASAAVGVMKISP